MADGRNSRFEALQSWRGICAAAVALFHFPMFGVTRSVPLIAHAYLFVDFFFVLSGFVIASAYEGRLDAPGERWQFVVRRFGRLWPLHVAVLAAFVLMAVAEGRLGADERHSVLAIFTNLLLIHGLGIHKDLTWNGPSWSISVEATVYVLFVLLSFIRGRVWVYPVLVLLGIVVLRSWSPAGMASTFDYGFFRGIAGFFTGCLIRRLPLRPWGLVAELAALALVGAFVWFGRLTLLSPFVFGVAVYVFAGARGPVSRLLQARGPTLLGDWSYSIYMVHAGVVAALLAVAPRLGLHKTGATLSASLPASLAAIAGYLVVVVALSAVTFALIEDPSRRFFNRLTAPMTRASADKRASAEAASGLRENL